MLIQSFRYLARFQRSTLHTARICPPSNLRLRMAHTLPKSKIFEAIASHDPESTAVAHYPSGRKFAYGGLLGDVADARNRLRQAIGDKDIRGQRIAFLIENSYDYVGAILVGFLPACGGSNVLQ